jgi:hypothetical protein
MPTSKPTEDNARKRAIRKRTQLRTKLRGDDRWTKRDKTSVQFMDQKKRPGTFKGVRKKNNTADFGSIRIATH